jgi:hypothetical protein
MKNLNHKTGQGRKVAAVMALTAAVAATLASAPASAYQRWTAAGPVARVHSESFLGHGNSRAKALADAHKNMRCKFGTERQSSRRVTTYTSMYNNTWFNATVTVTCTGIDLS